MESASNLGVDIGALSTRLRFNPQDGCIWLEGERMVLLHMTALASLRHELVDTLGFDKARGVLMRMGYTSGATDAALARRAKPNAELAESFMAGPRLHAIEGVAASDPVGYTVDPATGYHAGEWIWRNSIEVDAHLLAYGLSAEPACWMAIGYASAYTSAFMGRPILYREVECRATGAPRCRHVGKPAELWDDDVRDDLHHGFDLEAPDGERGSDWADITGEPDAFGRHSGDRLVGASAGFMSMMQMVDKVAKSQAVVLIVGEPGVGKKSCARLVHKRSNRAARPFVAFNCASLTGDQLDAELFGFEKGAVGNATAASRQGRIERANGGTLFLEDVHSLDMRAQTKLLRVLQTGEFERVGGSHPRPVSLRVIASSNDRLTEAVRDGQFREDLYYRLTVFPIVIPALKERRPDLPPLIRHFLEIFSKQYAKEISGVSEAAVGYLLTYDFPGNIAELESMIERAVIMAPDNGVLEMTHLAISIDARNPRFYGLSDRGLLIPKEDSNGTRHDTGALDRLLESRFELETFERELIARAVERASGNLSKAAKSLGLTRPQLAYRHRKVQDGDAVISTDTIEK